MQPVRTSVRPARPWILALLVSLSAPTLAQEPVTPAAPAVLPPSEPMPPAPTALSLATAVLTTIDDSDRDLDQMPFFVRPFARRSFAKRTGLSYDEWRERLGAIQASDTPATVRARWSDAEASLVLLEENFRTSPERAAKNMGDQPEVLARVTENARLRALAVHALIAWLRA